MLYIICLILICLILEVSNTLIAPTLNSSTTKEFKPFNYFLIKLVLSCDNYFCILDTSLL